MIVLTHDVDAFVNVARLLTWLWLEQQSEGQTVLWNIWWSRKKRRSDFQCFTSRRHI